MTKQFEVIVPFGMYEKGQIIAPTGLYRGMLLDQGYIRELPEVRPAAPVEATEQATPTKRKRGRPRKYKAPDNVGTETQR